MKHTLNIATAPQVNNRPFIAGAVVAGVISLMALGALSHATYVSWQANRELRSETAALQARIRASESQQQDLAAFFKTQGAQQVLDRAAFLNSLIGQRSFPWTKIFMDLENTLPPGVRVVSISPKLVDGRAEVSLVVGASNDENKIRFLHAIESSKVFSGVDVKDERQQESQPGNPDRVVVSLDFWYQTT
jgi:Tfp pilus assembly protein PilN